MSLSFKKWVKANVQLLLLHLGLLHLFNKLHSFLHSYNKGKFTSKTSVNTNVTGTTGTKQNQSKKLKPYHYVNLPVCIGNNMTCSGNIKAVILLHATRLLHLFVFPGLLNLM